MYYFSKYLRMKISIFCIRRNIDFYCLGKSKVLSHYKVEKHIFRVDFEIIFIKDE